jgi:hypothetical protein
VADDSGQARRSAGTQRRAGALTVGEVLRFDLLRSAVVLAGQAGIGRPVERLNVMTVPEILPWAKPHEFMLTTGYPLPRSAGQLAGLVRSFADRDLAAFGIKFGVHLRELPAEMLRAADEVQLPVIRIPEDVAFDDILSVVLSEIVNRQAMAISRAQQIHDSFLDIVLGGGALADIVAKLGELVPAAAIVVVDDAGQVLAESRTGQARRQLREADLNLPGLACSVFSAEARASNSARLCSRGTRSSCHWRAEPGHDCRGDAFGVQAPAVNPGLGPAPPC